MEKRKPELPLEEAERRRDEALKRALNTPPKPQADKRKPKKKTAPPERDRH